MPSFSLPHLLRSPYAVMVVAGVLLFAGRIGGLTTLPLHNDEGLHLIRAVEVWNGHPFWAIQDGKIVNHWAIALFYPQNAPDFVGRMPTLLGALLGLSAGIWIGRAFGGTAGGWLAAALWVGSAYLLFYERLAFSDAQAGALGVAAVAFTLRWRLRPTVRRAVWAGVWLAAAGLFKFTALPFALSVVLLVLWPRPLLERRAPAFRQRVVVLLTIAATGAILFLPPIAYLLLRPGSDGDLFSIARAWVGAGGGEAGGFPLFENARRMAGLIGETGQPLWAVVALVGLILLLRQARAWPLCLAAVLPTLVLLAFAQDPQPRHFAVLLPILVVAGGAGWGRVLDHRQFARSYAPDPAALPRLRQRFSDGGVVTLVIGVALLILISPFSDALQTDPPSAQLPNAIRMEHLWEHSSGYGLREAMRDLPYAVRYLAASTETPLRFSTDPLMPARDGEFRLQVARTPPVVLAAFFPDSCHRANFYAPPRARDGIYPETIRLECIGNDAATIRARLAEVLARDGLAYVLTDTLPIVSPPLNDFMPPGAQAMQIDAYPRPGDARGEEDVVLWRLN